MEREKKKKDINILELETLMHLETTFIPVMAILVVVIVHCHHGRSAVNKHLVEKKQIKMEKKKNIPEGLRHVMSQVPATPTVLPLSCPLPLVCVTMIVAVCCCCPSFCKSSLNESY